MRVVPEESFTITYDGPALATNRMDVRQLAPALMALADAVQAAHSVAAPLQTPPGLQIAATQPGSFSVDLLLRDAADLVGGAVDLLTSPEVGAIGAAMGISGVSLVGLVGWGIRVVKRRHASPAVREPEPVPVRPGWVRMTFSDQTSLEVPSQAVELADNLAFRQAMSGVVEPLRQPGVEDLTLIQDQQPLERITRADLPAFAAPVVEEELLSDSTRDVVLRLLSVSFVPGNKWKVSDGARDLWVSLKDVAFVQRVETNQESFRAGDLLRCLLRSQQWRKPNGDMRVEDSVVDVLHHEAGPRAVPLPFLELDPPSLEEDDDQDEDDEGLDDGDDRHLGYEDD